MSQELTCLLSDDVRDHFRGRELTGNVPIAEEKRLCHWGSQLERTAGSMERFGVDRWTHVCSVYCSKVSPHFMAGGSRH